MTSVALLDELERVLRYRFGLPAEAVAFARGDLELAADVVAPSTVDAVSRDPADDIVLAVAREGRVDRVVTGDQDLLAIARYEGTEIVAPREFIRLLSLR